MYIITEDDSYHYVSLNGILLAKFRRLIYYPASSLFASRFQFAFQNNKNYFSGNSIVNFSGTIGEVVSRLNNQFSNPFSYSVHDDTNILRSLEGSSEREMFNLITLYYDFPEFLSLFETNLYPELLDNSEQRSLALSYILNQDPDKELDPVLWTDTFLKYCQFVEEYNKNVLLLRSSRKVNASVSGSIFQSGQQSDLSGVENKLQNINTSLNNIKDDLQYTNTDDITKGLAQIESEKIDTKSIVVETVEKAPFNPFLDKDNNDIYGV